MRVIITGANGFVGSNLVKKLVENNIEVLAIDLSFNPSRLEANEKIETLELSIDNIASLKDKIAKTYDVFYHFAWVGSAGPLRCDEAVQVKTAMWTVDCLRTAHEIGCQKFICAGTIMEYEVHAAMYAPGSKPGAAYIYGVGKVLAHELCKPIANQLGIDLIWTYITNAYGVGEKSPRFINTTLRKIIHNEPLEFTAGTQNYDFVYIDDVANAFYLVGLHGKANKGYMIGSGNSRPLKEFIIEMCDANAKDNKPLFGNVPFTGVNVDINPFDISDLVYDCGFKPTVSFADGTKRTIEWLKEVD
jgi:nucleoside-diphosphate-sugar epimerase